MRNRSPVTAVLVGAVLAVAVVAAPGSAAAAQGGASSPTAIRGAGPIHPFPTRAIWAHEIMTYEERYDTWLKMREAVTPAERYSIWAKKRAELERRAAEHGMVLRDSMPMMVSREESYGGYAPYAAPHGAPGPLAAATPFAPGYYGAPYGARPPAPERPVPAQGWVGPHYFGVMPHLLPPMGR